MPSEHYSISVYRDQAIAERYEKRHFADQVGQYIHDHDISAIMGHAPSQLEIIADVGTGTGRIASGIRQLSAGKNARILAIDASQVMLHAARQRDPSITLLCADAHVLPLASRMTDLTVCFRVLMHSPDPSGLIRELSRISNRAVILDFPSSRSTAALHSFIRKILARYRKQTQAFRTFTCKQMEEMFAENGFAVRRISDRFVLPVFLHRFLANLCGMKFSIRMDLFLKNYLPCFSSSIIICAVRHSPEISEGQTGRV